MTYLFIMMNMASVEPDGHWIFDIWYLSYSPITTYHILLLYHTTYTHISDKDPLNLFICKNYKIYAKQDILKLESASGWQTM